MEITANYPLPGALPRVFALLQNLFAETDGNAFAWNVDLNQISVLNQGNGAALLGFWGDMADKAAVNGPGDSSVSPGFRYSSV